MNPALKLKQLDDLSPTEWIEKSKKPVTEAYKPVRVQNCLPSVFAAYCKLFHPIYLDPEVRDHSVSWHKAESQNVDSVGVRSGGALVRESSHGRMKGDRVRWSELANRHGLTFHPEINVESFTRAFADRSWPRYLLGPDEGTLDNATCDALVSGLSPHVGATRCYFYYSGLSVAGYAPQLYRGSLADVHGFLEMDHVNASPEYWWPEDHEWCIHTDWDLPFTLIGGSQAIVDAVANHPLLEMQPVTLMSRVDYQADQLNI